jgi:NAD(P)-dependent dehydrogenase (short-subunit alcohol dehydrogenase family)
MRETDGLTGSGMLPGQGLDLSGRVALVTASGANGGIGHACALCLARAGADVVTNSRGADHCAQTTDEILSLGRRSIAVAGDVGRAEDIEAIYAELDRVFGRIDILVNNAGIGARSRPEALSPDDWQRVIAVNMTGTYLCSRQAHRRMVQQGGGGSIVNIGSIAGSLSLGRGNFVYGLTKAAVHQMTRELAVEWASDGIRVNAVLPAQIMTPRLRDWLADARYDAQALMADFLHGIPMNRLGLPDEVAAAVLFLASDAAAYITGALLPVDGGNLALNAGGSHTWAEEGN